MERLLKYYCDTNTVNVCYDTAEPLLIRIDVQGEVGPRKSTASATVPNVSAESSSRAPDNAENGIKI